MLFALEGRLSQHAGSALPTAFTFGNPPIATKQLKRNSLLLYLDFILQRLPTFAEEFFDDFCQFV